MIVFICWRSCQGQVSLLPAIQPPPLRRKSYYCFYYYCHWLLRTEVPIRWLDPLHGEDCCPPGACIKDVTRKLPSLVQPQITNYWFSMLATVKLWWDQEINQKVLQILGTIGKRFGSADSVFLYPSRCLYWKQYPGRAYQCMALRLVSLAKFWIFWSQYGQCNTRPAGTQQDAPFSERENCFGFFFSGLIERTSSQTWRWKEMKRGLPVISCEMTYQSLKDDVLVRSWESCVMLNGYGLFMRGRQGRRSSLWHCM